MSYSHSDSNDLDQYASVSGILFKFNSLALVSPPVCWTVGVQVKFNGILHTRWKKEMDKTRKEKETNKQRIK